MHNNKKIGVVIPCYRARKTIIKVLNSLPNYVDLVVLVDDKCPEKTGDFVKKNISKEKKKKISILYNELNQGVGATVVKGYRELLKSKVDILVKIDSDDQMNSKQMIKLINPISKGKYNYVKGTRFKSKNDIKKVPFFRKIGNYMISVFSKITTGYWDIFDFLNGYTAIDKISVKKILNFKIDKRFFFETHMLVLLNVVKCKVKDQQVTINYKNNISNFFAFKEFFNFFYKNIINYFFRINLRYLRNNKIIILFYVTFLISSCIYLMIIISLNYLKMISFEIIYVPVISSLIILFLLFIYDYLNNPNNLR
tara:strand:- start:22530 stop:23459 length:930 start_codon:yes stop_codon:yes gene_type:complete